MLETIIERLGADASQTIPVVEEVGSVGAASVGLSLDRLLRSQALAPGDLILLAAVGSGISYGAMLYEVDG